MDNISIYPIQKDNITTPLLNIYRKAFAAPPYLESFNEQQAQDALRFVLEQKCGQVLCAQDGYGQLLGLSGGFLDGENFIIEELAVEPQQQGQGIGRKLFRSLLDRAQQLAPCSYELRTNKDNTRSISLYKSEGFSPTGESILVPGLRASGQYTLDERIYFTKPKTEIALMPQTLKRVTVAYPSGNTTAIVWDNLPVSIAPDLNESIMQGWTTISPGQPEIEQCCFVKQPNDPKSIARVEMFGGEFCGNATRSVIYQLSGGNDNQGLIEVSGCDRPLNFNLRNGVVELEMPTPKCQFVSRVNEGILVQLEGITQLVVEPDQADLRSLLNSLLVTNSYGLAGEAAVGICAYDLGNKKARFCVYVKAVDTVFDETACGSGTSAIGIASAFNKNAPVSMDIIQPSGEIISTQAQEVEGVITSKIKGLVKILYDGKYELEK